MTATVLSCVPVKSGTGIADGIYDLCVQLHEKARPARAGQFAHIACSETHLLRRPISLCDAGDAVFSTAGALPVPGAEGPALRFIFEVKGSGTLWLSERRPGDVLDLLYPLGRGFTCNPDESTLLVGGGLGVPPMLYAARRCGGKADAVLGYRNAARSFLVPNMMEACANVFLCSDDGSLGVHAFVDRLMRQRLEAKTYARVLACGPRPMLRAVAAVAESLGVPCEVSMEERMACGLGACLVCACAVKRGDAVHYAHVCQDGPVFDAREVDWS